MPLHDVTPPWDTLGMAREPAPLGGAIYHPGGGFHSYPPPKNRNATQRRYCDHCGLPADTAERSCPVCGTRYPATTRLGRFARRIRRAR